MPVIDEYHEDGEAAVFVEGRVITLSVLATTVLGELDEEWRDAGELVPALVESFGAPAEGSVEDAVASVLQTLAEHGLVETDPA